LRLKWSGNFSLSNGIVESMNTKLRLIMRRAFGFHSPEALIGFAMLDLRRALSSSPPDVKHDPWPNNPKAALAGRVKPTEDVRRAKKSGQSPPPGAESVNS